MATQPAGYAHAASRPERSPRSPLRTLPARRDGAALRSAPHGAGPRIVHWHQILANRAPGAARPSSGFQPEQPTQAAQVCDTPPCTGKSDRETLLVSLFPLVKHMALQFRSHLPASVEVDDLVGAGALGLLDAVDKFDASKHTQLATYARHRIRGSMLDSLRALDPASRSVRKLGRKIEKLYRQLGNQLGHGASDQEMAKALGLDLPAWYGILEKIQAVTADSDLGRTAQALAPKGAGVDGEVVADSQPGPFELLLRREQREILGRALAGLPERERTVVTLYYQRQLTMGQIATRLDVDESRISQIHSQALARLRSRVQALLVPPKAVRPPSRGVAEELHESPLLVLT